MTTEVAAVVVATDLAAATVVTEAVAVVVVDMAAEAVEVDMEEDHHQEGVVATEAVAEGKCHTLQHFAKYMI